MENEKEMEEMEEIVVKRDGERDLAFVGRLIASESTRTNNGPNNSRWNDYSVYRTKSGKYVFADEFTTLWQGEDDQANAGVFNSLEELFKYLENTYGMSFVVKSLAEQLEYDMTENID